MASIAASGNANMDEDSSSDDEGVVLEEGGGVETVVADGSGGDSKQGEGEATAAPAEIDVSNLIDGNGEIKNHGHNVLFRVLQTVFKMLKNREYIITDENLRMTSERFLKTYNTTDGSDIRNIMTQRCQHSANIDDQVFVFFLETFSTKEFLQLQKRMLKEGVSRGIIVSKAKPAAGVQKKVASANAPQNGSFYEVFQERELMVDITEHELVPEHRIMREEEKQALLKRYKLKESQLPRLRSTDPIARYFGLARGQVVKIIRPSETAGRYVTYRITW